MNEVLISAGPMQQFYTYKVSFILTVWSSQEPIQSQQDSKVPE